MSIKPLEPNVPFGIIHPLDSTIEPWAPNPEAARAVDQAIEIARLMPEGEKRARFLGCVSSVWMLNNSMVCYIEREATE